MAIIKKKRWQDKLWDAWCIASIIGIWPRFIEPRLLCINHLNLSIEHLPTDLQGLKILHFSDLHWHAGFYPSMKARLLKQIKNLKPDLIIFTGDFICRSHLEEPDALRTLLCGLEAPLGCFAVLGNHDYSRFVTVNEQGDYDVDSTSSPSNIVKGFKRLFSRIQLSKRITPTVSQVQEHGPLLELLKRTPFQLLHNETCLLPVGKSFLNICGLGEYTLGRLQVDQAFQQYDTRYPGLILAHNPDAIPHLTNQPGQLILSGHTHGGQINLPWMWQKFTCLENRRFKRGLMTENGKWVYINRGIGSVMTFRWFSPPELTCITLQAR